MQYNTLTTVFLITAGFRAAFLPLELLRAMILNKPRCDNAMFAERMHRRQRRADNLTPFRTTVFRLIVYG